MAKPEESQRLGVAQSQENRAHARRKLAPMAYVELGQDNGGILLNLGEGGFAVQSALALTSRDFPSLRFQVPHAQGWLTASGKIAWLSESKKEAGIQFTDLPSTSRSEIRKWVASDDSSQSSGSEDPRTQMPEAKPDIFTAPQRRAAPLVSANTRTNGASVRRQAPTRAPVTTPSEPPVAPAAVNPQEFHFTDYSMFAAEPEQEHIWIKTEKKGMGWGALTLVALLLSALFFVLGAKVGRSTVEQWMAYVTGSSPRQNSSPPEATTSAPSDKATSEQPSADASQSAGDEPDTSASTATPAPASDSPSSAPENAQPAEPESSKAQDQSRTPSGTEHLAQNSAVAARKERLSKNSAPLRRAEQSYPQVAPPRSYDDLNAGAASNLGEHAILVNAPAPGSPPFLVNLPSDPVSASSSVAISAQRSIAIAPKAGSYGRAQRVVIGKLLSHSDPFYPAEARSKRIQGSVVLHVMIGRTGHIIGVTPVRGPTELVKAATTAVREWRYEPTYVDGDPAETQADVTLVFRLP